MSRARILQKFPKISVILGGLLLFLSAYNGATAPSPAPDWLTGLLIIGGVLNFITLFKGLYQLPSTSASLELLTGFILLVSGIQIFSTGHRNLAMVTIFAAVLWLGIATFHLLRIRQNMPGVDPEIS